MKSAMVIMFSVSILLGCKQEASVTPTLDDTSEAEVSPEEAAVSDTPGIVFTQLPEDQIEGHDVEARFEVVPGAYPVVNIRCEVDGIPRDCLPEGDTIVVENPALGEHVITIIIADTSERAVRREARFTIHDPVSYTHLTLPTTPYV